MCGSPKGARSRLAIGTSPFLTDVAENAVYPTTGTLGSTRRASHRVLQAALDIGIDGVVVEATISGLAEPAEVQERAQLASGSACLELFELLVGGCVHGKI